MAKATKNPWDEVLTDALRRMPAAPRFVQEAFSTDHRHVVQVKLNDIATDTFYWFEEIPVCAFFDAVVDWAVRQGGGKLTVSYTMFGEAKAQEHRLQHAAGKLDGVCVLSVGRTGKELMGGARIECVNTNGTPLARYRIALAEGKTPLLFICREEAPSKSGRQRSLGFCTSDADVVEEIADDIEALVRGQARALETFEKLELLHQTTQQVTRELESYSRRMELAVRRAQRRPDLLTPARFERIVTQAIAKMEELKEIPRRALRTIDKPRR